MCTYILYTFIHYIIFYEHIFCLQLTRIHNNCVLVGIIPTPADLQCGSPMGGLTIVDTRLMWFGFNLPHSYGITENIVRNPLMNVLEHDISTSIKGCRFGGTPIRKHVPLIKWEYILTLGNWIVVLLEYDTVAWTGRARCPQLCFFVGRDFLSRRWEQRHEKRVLGWAGVTKKTSEAKTPTRDLSWHYFTTN